MIFTNKERGKEGTWNEKESNYPFIRIFFINFVESNTYLAFYELYYQESEEWQRHECSHPSSAQTESQDTHDIEYRTRTDSNGLLQGELRYDAHAHSPSPDFLWNLPPKNHLYWWRRTDCGRARTMSKGCSNLSWTDLPFRGRPTYT